MNTRTHNTGIVGRGERMRAPNLSAADQSPGCGENEIRGSQDDGMVERSALAGGLAPPDVGRQSGIALVITLLMLSVITFLAIALLVLTRGNRSQVDVTLDVKTAQNMSDAAESRAVSQIIARLQAHQDMLNYDYISSHNWINPNGFTNSGNDAANVYNVNYDFYATSGSAMNPTANGGQDWAQNIANLFYDPRPPVFIKTNAYGPADFRFWVDINRNGRFETNGFLPQIGQNGLPEQDTGGNLIPFFGYGEPEWIGVLQYPGYAHSATNRFIGRYAYMVLPIGKTLDLNYIHNFSKSLLGTPTTFPIGMPSLTSNGPPTGVDGFMRNQGVGSWELNLAGFLWGLNTNIYTLSPFNYYPASAERNSGWAFNDAYSILRYRYAGDYGGRYPPASLTGFFAATFAATPSVLFYLTNSIDEYGTGAFQSVSAQYPWPGGYATNGDYDIQDLFDPTKTGVGFVDRLKAAGNATNSFDRYTFQRLLAGIGTGSAPELQAYVYDDVTNLVPGLPPTRLRSKVNINWDNSYQITNGFNTSPTVLIPWTNALAFFTNAAESLLRSQDFRFTNNYYTTNPVVAYMHIGLTNIPVYDSLNPSIRYSEQIHRMLQVAANIYEATIASNAASGSARFSVTSLPAPVVFRPLFYTTNYGHTNQVLRIIGYARVTNNASQRILDGMIYGSTSLGSMKMPWDPSITTDDNVWGIPWVIGTVKGLPAFDRYVNDSSWMVTRKLLFKRVPDYGHIDGSHQPYGRPNQPPQYTNQFFIMSLNNVCGIDAWNPSRSSINVSPSSLVVMGTNYVYVSITNNSATYPGGGWNAFGTLAGVTSGYTNVGSFWRAGPESGSGTSIAGMRAFLQTNSLSLAQSYFSESDNGKFLPVSGNVNSNGFNLGQFVSTNQQFLVSDTTQTTWPVYDWTLTVSNQIMYALLDANTGAVYDFVNIGPFGQTIHLTNLLFGSSYSSFTLAGGVNQSPLQANYWDPTLSGPGLPNRGIMNQISNGIRIDNYFAAELTGSTNTSANNANTAGSTQTVGNSNLYFSCDNDRAATVFTTNFSLLLANDPMVHYTLGDLTPPAGLGTNVMAGVLTDNQRYEPWPSYSVSSGTIGANLTFKDPLIESPDEWAFPTNQFPSVGWLGRVHRGTPWQTIFLKADGNPNVNPLKWINDWVSTLDTYPTTDYGLVDLFTTAPNDNAARGQLSVNQTNDAPWYAVFTGLIVQTNIGGGSSQPMVLSPADVAPLLSGYAYQTYNSQGQLSNVFVAGINSTRAAQNDGVFHNTGSIYSAPSLSINSPFLPEQAGDFTDDEVEAIPQQIAGLIKLGQPRFVIYSWGQALKPKDIYFGSQTNLFNLCTNYQITGEYLTRTVCHVVGNPVTGNLKLQVDAFNILPAD